ncbi:LysR family transcriptional regulator [Rhodobacterales bacterium HKCCE2091]|nr:LysR family transcriptional regulator [Rhodobacterales bacterium HKCCE2091]
MQALLVLCELRSMGRAAQAMGITQPAMSVMVAELERLLETQLFKRHSKGVDPTPSALDLLPVAQRIVSATEEGAERVASYHRREGGLVRVASTAAATGALLDTALPEFGASHPNIMIRVVTVIGHTLDAAFSGDVCDMVCCRRREVLADGWEFEPLVSDELVVVAAMSHPLARKDKVTVTDLAAATWVQHEAVSLARDEFDQLRSRLGWAELNLVHVVSRIPLVSWSMLRDGRLLSLVPRGVVMPWVSIGLLKELEVGLNLRLAPIGVHWRPDKTGRAARLFLESLRQAAGIAEPETFE